MALILYSQEEAVLGDAEPAATSAYFQAASAAEVESVEARSVLQIDDVSALNRRSSAGGRTPDPLLNHDDRDARPIRCNGW